MHEPDIEVRVKHHGAEESAHPASQFRHVQLPESELNFEDIKNAIYLQMQILSEENMPAELLRLSRDIYEILNKRLVFKSAAYKETAHFITPYGNLIVADPKAEVPEPRSFVIE